MKTWLSRLFSARAQSDATTIPDSKTSNSDTAKYKEAGDQFLRDGDFLSAIEAYRQAIDHGAASVGLLCNLAFALKETAQLDEAQQILDKALIDFPNNADCHHVLGEITRQSGKVDIAIRHFREAIAVAPDFEEAYRELCITLFGIGQFQDALDVAQAGLARLPHSADLHFWSGNLYHQLQKPDEAIAEFDAALAIAPNRLDILHNLSLNLIYTKQTRRAITALRQITDSPQVSVSTLNNLAICLQGIGEFTEAIAHLQRALLMAPDDASSLIHMARALWQSGRPGDAIPHLLQASAISPHNFDILFDLAGVYAASGAHDLARDRYREAGAINPENPAPRIGEALALCEMHDFEQALPRFRSALVHSPESALIYLNAANAFKELKRFSEAALYYKRVLHIEPDSFDVNLLLGTVLHEKLDFAEAMESYRRALALNPKSHLVHLNLGRLFSGMNRHEAAASSLQEASMLAPDDADILHALAQSLKTQGKNGEATVAWKNALVADPAFEPAWSSLAGLSQESHAYADARRTYLRALALEPDNTDTLLSLGNALTQLQLYDEAIACFERAIHIKPSFVGAYGNLANILSDVGRHQEAIDTYQQALQNGPIDFRIYSNLLFARNYMPDVPSSILVEEAIRYGELVAQQAKPYDSWHNDKNPQRCLRVGLVSGDLRHHPVGFFIDSTLAAFAADPNSNIEVIAYSNFAQGDYLTERIKSHCFAWRQIDNLSDDTVAKQIRSDDIDILLDLSGHSSLNRLPLFAHKPAPVQASWLGYFATTGVSGIDHFIADPWSVPPGAESQFTEKIWRLPETRFSFTAPDSFIEVSPLPALQNGVVTFGCFNNLSKMTDQVVALWARIMHEMPDSRLFLKSLQLGGEKVRSDVIARFAAHNITKDRLQLEGFTSRAEYLAAYHRVDIALDPFPYTGGATTAESLWMGVPVFTLTGERLIARQGTSLLMNAGLSDWIAATEQDYIDGVVKHAKDLASLAALRSRLRQQVLASPLFDAPRFAKNLHVALREMWSIRCAETQSDQTIRA